MNSTYATENLPVGTNVRYTGRLTEFYGRTGRIVFTGNLYGILLFTGEFLSRVNPSSLICLLGPDEVWFPVEEGAAA